MIHFHNKRLALIDNSPTGQVQADTVFEFQQRGSMITARYHGGGIVDGHIIGTVNDSEVHLLYHCFTNAGELLSGKATGIATIQNDQLHLLLDWKWLTGDQSSGKSHYHEISN